MCRVLGLGEGHATRTGGGRSGQQDVQRHAVRDEHCEGGRTCSANFADCMHLLSFIAGISYISVRDVLQTTLCVALAA